MEREHSEGTTEGAGHAGQGGDGGIDTGPADRSGHASEDRMAAGGVITAHTLQHTYQHGFYVLLPQLYIDLGLTPVTAGVLEMVRKVSAGVATMGGGVVLDRYQDKRIAALYLSLIAMGVGYLLVGISPSYGLILVAAALAGAAGSAWHPAALGLLSQAFPRRRGFVIAMHRSAGSVGDVIGPLAVGGLLLVVSWRTILVGAMPLALLFAFLLWLVLLRAPSWDAFRAKLDDARLMGAQMRAFGGLLRNRSLLMLLLISGLSGLGQGGLLMWMGLYLSQTQGMGSVGIGLHIALLTGIGIVTGPMVGLLSDRVGRRPVIISVLAAKTVFATMLALTGSGLLFTLSVALMGAVMFGVNSLIQAAALDVAEGQRMEGSMIGLLWGSNALFTGAAPLMVGLLIETLGFGVFFWYVAAMNLCAAVTATLLPELAASKVTSVRKAS